MRYLTIDTETTGLDIYKGDAPYAVFTCDDNGKPWHCVWDVDPFTRQPKVNRKDLRKLESIADKRELVFHNAKYDIGMLEKVGTELQWRGKTHDTGISSHITNSATHRKYNGELKELALHYCDYSDLDEELLRKYTQSAKHIIRNRKLGWKLTEDGKDKTAPDYWVLHMLCKLHPDLLPETTTWKDGDDPKDHPWATALSGYGGADAERTMMLHLTFIEFFDDDQWKCYRREQELIPILYDMNHRGFSLFPKHVSKEVKRYSKESEASVSAMQKQLRNPDFNPNAPQQLSDALFKTMKLQPIKKTSSGGWSTDKYVIADLYKSELNKRQQRFLDSLVMYKNSEGACKYLRSYLKFMVDGRLHPNINQCGTGTTRVASSDPNGQQVGKGKELEEGEKPEFNLRSSFGPSAGRIWYCLDYSQLQLRIFAYLADEHDLIQAFHDGYDAHTFMAMRIFNKPADQISKLERRIAKNVNFGFIFGAQPKKIELTAGMPGLWGTVTKMFPSASAFMENTKKMVYRKKCVYTPFGYKLNIPYKDGRLAAHAGVNYIVQGCEGDMVKNAMIGCYARLKEDNNDRFLMFQVHDELIFDFPINKPRSNTIIIKQMKRIMEQAGSDFGMVTPVDIEYTTTNWSETKALAA